MQDNLTPTLTGEQLKQNISAMKGKVPDDKIQSYVNNYKGDGKGGYTLSNQSSPIQQNSTPVATQQDTGNPVANFFKGIASAPLTLLARPFQAGAELLGASDKSVNDISNKISGGLIAPTPQNYSDVEKDVGRGAQTVALGLGPVSGGALFGAGNSLEQGNDLLSTQTAFQTALGGVGGKLLDFVGKPLLDAAGKVIGKITPDVLKDVASKGTSAIQNFAKNHSLLPEDLSKSLTSVANTAEDVANKPFDIAGKPFKSLGNTVKNSISDRYYNQNASDLSKPTSIPKPAYNKATQIFNNAKEQGVDLGKELTDTGIKYSDVVNNRSFDTKDTAQMIRDDTGRLSKDLLRPSLEKANSTVPKVSVNDLRDTALENAMKDKSPDKADIIDDIKNTFNDKRQGSLYSDYKKGFSLTDLHDNKIKFSKGVYNATKPAKNISEKYISDAFRTTLENNAPKEIPVKEFNAALSKKYKSADYLEALHGKSAPTSIGQKIARTSAKVAGAVGGHALGGGLLGEIGGYHIGGYVENAIENMSNPIKKYFLDDLEKSNPKVFKKVTRYLNSRSTSDSVANPISNASNSNPIQQSNPIVGKKSMSISDIHETMKNPIRSRSTAKSKLAFNRISKLK